MPNLADLLDGRLDIFSYSDLDRVVASLSDESHRIEVKQDWPSNRELAHDVCAFANGRGGAIIIGYSDPRRGLEQNAGVDGSSGKIDAAFSAIHALTWPSVHCVIRSFSGDSGHVAVAIVIPPSSGAPHEYIGDDKPNLPIRRGRSKKGLTLSEIFALRRRAENISVEPPQIGYPIVSLNTQEGTFWGVEFSPSEWPEEPFVFGNAEDVAFQNYWRQTYSPTLEIRPNGIRMLYEAHDLVLSVVVHTDGTIVVWWRTSYRPWMYFAALLEMAYGFASMVFSHLQLSPRALMRVRWNIEPSFQDENLANERFPFPTSGELLRRVDFSRNDIDGVLTYFFEQTDRLAGRSRPRNHIESEIREGRGSIRYEDPRARWGAL